MATCKRCGGTGEEWAEVRTRVYQPTGIECPDCKGTGEVRDEPEGPADSKTNEETQNDD